MGIYVRRRKNTVTNPAIHLWPLVGQKKNLLLLWDTETSLHPQVYPVTNYSKWSNLTCLRKAESCLGMFCRTHHTTITETFFKNMSSHMSGSSTERCLGMLCPQLPPSFLFVREPTKTEASSTSHSDGKLSERCTFAYVDFPNHPFPAAILVLMQCHVHVPINGT